MTVWDAGRRRAAQGAWPSLRLDRRRESNPAFSCGPGVRDRLLLPAHGFVWFAEP